MKNLRSRTGKDKAKWLEILRREGPDSDGERREWLRSVHGFTTNYAMWITEEAAGRGIETYDPDALVDEQYEAKPLLRPIYEELLRLCFSLGDDVKACPGVTAVPFYRKNVFAQIKATTNTRVDLGLCLRGHEPTERLVATGGEQKGDRITHRIGIASLSDVDDAVQRLLRRAYDATA